MRKIAVRKCKRCNKDFRKKKSDNGFYCSQRCYFEDRKKIRIKNCIICGKRYDDLYNNKGRICHVSVKIFERSKFCSKDCFFRNNIGKKRMAFSEEWRRNIGLSNRGKRTGCKSNFWKGGITPVNLLLRNGSQYKDWRIFVFKRDNFTCKKCGDNQGRNLNAHHIKSFSKYPELRFDVNNGCTLCIPCHRQTDSYGEKIKNKS